MATWTVVHSSDFIAQITSIHAEFKRKYDHALRARSRPEVEKTDPPFKEFEDFTQAVLDLKDGKSDPAKVLKYRTKDALAARLFFPWFMDDGGPCTGSMSQNGYAKAYRSMK